MERCPLTAKAQLSEHHEQAAVIRWANLHTATYPELALLFAIPNMGKRHISFARKLKAEGLKAGVPDLFLPVANYDYHGLFIEMKRAGGRTSPEQKMWIAELTAQNYRAEVCVGAENALIVIRDYLGIRQK